MSLILFLLSLLFLGLTGCEVASDGPVTITDSAGVRLTLNADVPKIFAEVDPEPLLTFGGDDVSGPVQFFRIQNVVVDQEDRLWVADGQSAELRVFHSDGSHWKTLGGSGEGPGEFLRLRLLGTFHGDSIAAWDDAIARLTVFDAEGELVRTQRLPSGDDPPIRATDMFQDGSLLGQIPRILSAISLEPGDILGDSVRLVRVNMRDSTQVLVAGALGPLWLWTGRNQVPIPFTTNAGFEVHGDKVHLVAGSEYRIRVFEAGQVTAIYGIARNPRGVSESDFEAYRAFTEEYIPESGRADYLTALDHPEVPARLPAYSRVLAASDGTVWTRLYSSRVLGPATWDVFDAQGEWLGQVETPGGFTVLSIAKDRVTGVWRNDQGVEHIRVYRLRESPEST
jgi:hypothetical protein